MPGAFDIALAPAYWRLGQVIEWQGDMDGARAQYDRASELDSELESVKETLARLDRGDPIERAR